MFLDGQDGKKVDMELYEHFNRKLREGMLKQKQAYDVRLKDVVEIAKVQVVAFVKKQAEEISKMLSYEHQQLILKFRSWIDISEELLAKCDSYDKRTYQAEKYSALVNPVLEAEYALDDDTPLSLYDCVACTIRRTNKYMSPYDAFDNETIMNWRTVAQENDELREVVNSYKNT